MVVLLLSKSGKCQNFLSIIAHYNNVEEDAMQVYSLAGTNYGMAKSSLKILSLLNFIHASFS